MSDGLFRVSPWSGLFWKFVAGCALVLGLYSILQMSQATVGVGLAALACLLAILARINQAELHHRQRLEADHGARVLQETARPADVKDRATFG